MAGMYEKLGDLLSETLEAGHVKFVHIEREPEAGPDSAGAGGKEQAAAGGQGEDPAGSNATGTADFAGSFYKAEREAERKYFRTSRGGEDSGEQARRVIYKRVSPELEKAFALLSLDCTASKDAVRRAYKEKLLQCHPDRYAGKELMEKIATDKTRELVAAYKLLMDFLG